MQRDYLAPILLGFIFVTACHRDAQTVLRFLTVYLTGYGRQFTTVMTAVDAVLALPRARVTIYDSIQFLRCTHVKFNSPTRMKRLAATFFYCGNDHPVRSVHIADFFLFFFREEMV